MSLPWKMQAMCIYFETELQLICRMLYGDDADAVSKSRSRLVQTMLGVAAVDVSKD